MAGGNDKNIGAGGLVALLSVCSVLGMLGSSSFSALLPEFQQLWGLSNTEAGWISGIFYGGYVVGVPVLVGLTDRVDARRIYLLSLVITAAAALGYGLLAQGFVSAFLFRALAGLGLAGTYMPGLKLMTDRIGAHPRQGRYVAYYTAGFSLGTAASYPFSAEMAQWLGWRWAFSAAALGAGLALLLVLALVAPMRPESMVSRHLFDFRPVFRNRPAMAFVWGYTGHTWELFALRSWLVAFLIHAQSAHGGGSDLSGASWITTAIVLLSTLSSIYGAEAAARADRRRVIGRVMIASVACAILAGFSSPLPLPAVAGLCLLYHLAVMGDSAALTGGAVAMAAPGQRGATLAVHSVLGFTGGFVGPLAVGVVLDLAGGEASNLAWGLAFTAMGAGSAAALVAIRKL
ncbi:MAG TPA: MFS transporter [Stellaceae bacterium]|nr:MFS transporter [Stellaceae bacterium]